MLDLKSAFPIFQNRDIVYLDSAATTQKLRVVIEKEKIFYENFCANVHRGIYKLSEQATELYENARAKIASFINAKPEEIIFVKNATEGLNLIATCLSNKIKESDFIATSLMEHHSNFLPFMKIKSKKILLEFDKDDFVFNDANIEKLEENEVKILSITWCSNVLGVVNDLKKIFAKAPNAIKVVDASQAAAHFRIDVRDLDCDFLVFTGHKMFGPTGIGVVYGKEEILADLDPFLFGGQMIKSIDFANGELKTNWSDIPYKFEAGTPNFCGAIALGAAIDFIEKIGFEKIAAHEKRLRKYFFEKIEEIRSIKLYQKENVKAIPLFSFNLGDIHSHDVAQILSNQNICIRSGHHCAIPLHKYLGIAASARASFSIYNNFEDVDKLIEALKRAEKIFKLC